jgi:uncharacterized protein YdiU (UPF0061 family)
MLSWLQIGKHTACELSIPAMLSMFMRHYSSMHGVINTDNVSIMGLTIDYGPYAFMDVYNPGHICNHSDDTGRYSFAVSGTLNLTC